MNSPLKFSVIIPARYRSTRLPGKPLADIAGRPMVIRVADQARRSGASEVVIATDHEGIAAAAAAYGHDALMTSPRHASGTDRLAEVAARRRYPAGHVVVNVQGDEPLIDPRLIREVAVNLARRPAAHMATACHPIRDARELFNPGVVKVVLDEDGYARYFSRAPIPYARDAFALSTTRMPRGLPAYRHLGIYAYRAGFLRRYARLAPVAIERFEALEQLRVLAHGFQIAVAVTRRSPHAGVDTVADLRRVRRTLALSGSARAGAGA